MISDVQGPLSITSVRIRLGSTWKRRFTAVDAEDAEER